MMCRSLGLLVLTAGCAASAVPVETPKTETDVPFEQTLPPSALTPLGVTESVGGTAPDRELTVRGVTALVAACVKPALEREPKLRGSLSFQLAMAPEITVQPASGALADLGAASCVRDALARVSPAPTAKGTIEYTLTFGGAYLAAPVRPDAVLHSSWSSLDWTTPGAEAPEGVKQSTEALAESLHRCAFGAVPALDERLWLTLRVAAGGAVTLSAASPGDASGCVARRLRGTTFPDAGHDYAMSVVLRPEILQAQSANTESEPGQEFGIIGLLDPRNAWGDSIGDAFGAGGSHGAKPPKVRMGATQVKGRLPPEVIQRIVRQNFGRFRLCYEKGLKGDPKLAGKVTVSFEIAPDGSTRNVTSTTDLKDKTVGACVQRAFGGLSYPQPEGGSVTVVYPISFSPGEDAPSTTTPAAPPPPRTIDGKQIPSVSLTEIEGRLTKKGFTVAPVPGFTAGGSPALFVRDDAFTVHSIFFGPPREAARVRPREVALCLAGSQERSLHVRGDGCHRLMDLLLD